MEIKFGNGGGCGAGKDGGGGIGDEMGVTCLYRYVRLFLKWKHYTLAMFRFWCGSRVVRLNVGM